MPTGEDQDPFSLAIERQKSGASENKVRFAFQCFAEINGHNVRNDLSQPELGAQ